MRAPTAWASPTPSAMPIPRWCASCSSARCESPATAWLRPLPRHARARAGERVSPHGRSASRASMPASPASAAARTRRARAATSRPKTSPICSPAWALPTGQDFDRADRAARARSRSGSTARRCTARSGAPACRRRWRARTEPPRAASSRSHGARAAAQRLAAAAARRPARRRVHAHGDGPDLRHDAGRPGRRSDQGRADRRRPHAPAAGRGRRLLPDVQPQQEEHRDRPAPAARAPRWRASSRASADVVAENFKPGTMGKYGLDYAALSQVNPRAHLRQPQGLPARARTTTAPRSTKSCR